MKVAICDDNKVLCKEIGKSIINCNPNYCIDLFCSGYDLLNAEKIYDIVFLDIEMDELNGMKTAQLLRERKNNEHIIFLTSHSEFMQEAFKVKAFRFLNKPVKQMELEEALLNAENEINCNEKLIINEKNKVEIINLNNIIYFEAYGDGTYIYTQNGYFESIKSLKYWNDVVKYKHFYQVHRSYLVSLKYVRAISASSVEVQYCNRIIPVSRRKYPLFKRIFLDYVKNNAQFL